MDYELLIFQLKVLSSITPNVPLADNLRGLMGPALAKVRDASKARVAIHAFVNPEIHELHTLVIGRSLATTESLRLETMRRHTPSDAAYLMPQPTLPAYQRLDFGTEQET